MFEFSIMKGKEKRVRNKSSIMNLKTLKDLIYKGGSVTCKRKGKKSE
jgi:hypothetical protein